MSAHPLSEGNRLQRAYHAWAAPRYARMPADIREQVIATDCFFYSRRGLVVWLSILGGTVALVLGLRLSGTPWLLSTALGLVAGVSMPLVAVSAWLMPNVFSRGKHMSKLLLLTLAGGGCGLVVGFAVGHVGRHGHLDLPLLGEELARKAGTALPVVALAAVALLGSAWALARVRRQVLERQLAHAAMQSERDASAREAAEARLKLLQAQVQPHFIFNTLAALQHWVDTGDDRAPPLLRTLTAFLRGSTELLGREQVPLAEEAAMAGHYLAIMQGRLGQRLRYTVDVAPALGAEQVPPGLLLTLVENAVEHGVAPQPDGGEVRVEARADGAGWWLQVADSGAGLAADWHEGLGLANCRQRLRHAYGERATLSLGPGDPGSIARITVGAAAP